MSSAHIQEQLAELKMYFPDEKPAQPSVPTPPRRTSKDLVAAAEQMMANAKEVFHSSSFFRGRGCAVK